MRVKKIFLVHWPLLIRGATVTFVNTNTTKHYDINSRRGINGKAQRTTDTVNSRQGINSKKVALRRYGSNSRRGITAYDALQAAQYSIERYD